MTSTTVSESGPVFEYSVIESFAHLGDSVGVELNTTPGTNVNTAPVPPDVLPLVPLAGLVVLAICTLICSAGLKPVPGVTPTTLYDTTATSGLTAKSRFVVKFRVVPPPVT